MAPHNEFDIRGTEDPRIQYDPAKGLYYMFYTCFGYVSGGQANNVQLCHASTRNPTVRDGWTLLGPVFDPSKSATQVSFTVYLLAATIIVCMNYLRICINTLLTPHRADYQRNTAGVRVPLLLD